jgi:type IV pilus assembly protein PilN
MIRINLLPVKAARKHRSVQNQLILLGVLLLGGLVGLYLWYDQMAGKIDQRKKQISQTQQQIEQYKKAIGEVEKFKGLEDQLKRKLDIIESLVKGKTGPVKVLDRLSNLIPKQVWLTSWQDKDGRVTMEGEALSNKWVSQFVTALKESREKGAETDAPSPAPAPPPPPPAAKPGAKPGAQPVAAPPAPRPLGYFSNVQIVTTETFNDKDANRSFVKFKVVMTVNYSI